MHTWPRPCNGCVTSRNETPLTGLQAHHPSSRFHTLHTHVCSFYATSTFCDCDWHPQQPALQLLTRAGYLVHRTV
eukprot:4062177-Prymnesium_polylepis.1